MHPASIETITPKLAQKYLDGMPKNRRVREQHVIALAIEIQRGKWQVNGETIKFNKHGVLIDGQHRLHAIIRANKDIQSYVVRELDKDTIETIDLGMKRSPGDIFELEGHGNAINLCAALRWLWRYENGYMKSYPYSPSIDTLKEVYARHPMAKDSLTFGNMTAKYIMKSLSAALFCLFAEKDVVYAQKLFYGVSEGEGLQRDDPVFLLRRRLFDNSLAKAKLPPHEMAALVIKTFNALREGKKMRMLRWRNQGEVTEDFPTIL